MSDAISRRIKQLENQNLKFKKLLESTLQITNEQTAAELQIKTETKFLKIAITQIEEQKIQLENELKFYLSQNLDEEECSRYKILQDEHVDVQSKLISSLNDIQNESTEIQQLKTEDEHLNQVIAKLEKEKETLLEQILQVKKANEENDRLACENLKLRQELSRLEQESSGKSIFDKNFSAPDLVQRLASIENLKQKLQNELKASTATLMDPLNISTENTVLELKISGLAKQKQKILKELRTNLLRAANEVSQLHSNTSDCQLKNLLNELDIHKAVLMINLSNIKKMSSFEKQETKLVVLENDQETRTEDEENNQKIKTEDKENDQKPSIQEEEKHREDNSENSPINHNSNCEEYCNLSYSTDKIKLSLQKNYEISHEMGQSQDIKKEYENYVNQQINIKEFLGTKEHSESTASYPTSKSDSEHLSISSFRSNSSEMIQEITEMKDGKSSDHNLDSISDDELAIFEQEIHDLPTVSEEEEPQNDLVTEHIQLKEMVGRLEREKLNLLEQLQSVNAATAASQNLPYDTLLRKESSEHFRRLPLDDATNQMYVNEEQLLEQRIRELEEDNDKIRRNLVLLMEELRSDNEDLAILETGERLIKENQQNPKGRRKS